MARVSVSRDGVAAAAAIVALGVSTGLLTGLALVRVLDALGLAVDGDVVYVLRQMLPG